MKKIKRLFITSMALVLLSSGSVYARDWNTFNEFQSTQVASDLLEDGVTVSRDSVQGDARSTALATAMSEITNEGNGVIGIYAETTMHTSVDWACLTVYLERWYEEYGTWQIEATFEKEFLVEDEADGTLTSATFFTDVTNQETEYYYRVRTLHELEFDDGWYEAKVTKTDGILITSAP